MIEGRASVCLCVILCLCACEFVCYGAKVTQQVKLDAFIFGL